MSAPRWWRTMRRRRPLRTRTVLQMEAVECGAASLASILGFHGRYVTLDEARSACGVSRDGVTAGNLVRAARSFGLEATGYKREPAQLADLMMPCVLFWNFNHFVVLEGLDDEVAWLNDPATGPRTVSLAELDASFTGVVLTMTPGPTFTRGGAEPGVMAALRARARGAEGAILFAIVAGLAMLIPGFILPAFARIFVDQILVQGLVGWMPALMLGLGLSAFLRGVLKWLRGYVLLRLATRVSVVESARFLWHILRLPVEFFTQRSAGDISGRVALNATVAGVLAGPVATTAIDVILVGSYAVLMLLYDWQLGLLSMVIAGINLAFVQRVAARRIDGHQRLLKEAGKFEGTLLGGLANIETLKATSREGDLFAKLAGHQATLANESQAIQRAAMLPDVAPDVLTGIGAALVLVIGGHHVMLGTMTLGMLVGFQTLQSSFFEPVQRLIGLGNRLQELVGEIGRLADVMSYPVDDTTRDDLPPTETQTKFRVISVRETQVDLRTMGTMLSGRIELQDVTFGYSRLAPPLLRNFNLSLAPGSRVALVGASGCGKSTVSKLVCRLFRPWSGQILFDGIPADDIERDLFSASVAFVDQDLSMFAGTIRDTLTLWDYTVPEWRMVAAARDACIHDVITARPGGYDGRLEEGGHNFSGGQRQRLDIARALCTDPRILVLDEATSALDTVTEAEIDRNIRRRGCTCLIVAHRLSTVRDCDEIIVLEQGEVVQRGAHDQLLADAQGPYARLLDLQEDADAAVLS